MKHLSISACLFWWFGNTKFLYPWSMILNFFLREPCHRPPCTTLSSDCVIRQNVTTHAEQLVPRYVRHVRLHTGASFLKPSCHATVMRSLDFWEGLLSAAACSILAVRIGTMLCSTACRRCCNGDPSHKKDSAWAWIVCLAAATNLAFSSGLVYSFGVLLPVFMDYFKESRENTGKLLNSETTLGPACE